MYIRISFASALISKVMPHGGAPGMILEYFSRGLINVLICGSAIYDV